MGLKGHSYLCTTQFLTQLSQVPVMRFTLLRSRRKVYDLHADKDGLREEAKRRFHQYHADRGIPNFGWSRERNGRVDYPGCWRMAMI